MDMQPALKNGTPNRQSGEKEERIIEIEIDHIRPQKKTCCGETGIS